MTIDRYDGMHRDGAPPDDTFRCPFCGKTARIDPEQIHVITGSGRVNKLIRTQEEEPEEEEQGGTTVSTPVQTVVTIEDDCFVVEGAGYGHQLGMSQYGAYAMAGEGFEFDEIVEFYYPGVEVDYCSCEWE